MNDIEGTTTTMMTDVWFAIDSAVYTDIFNTSACVSVNANFSTGNKNSAKVYMEGFWN